MKIPTDTHLKHGANTVAPIPLNNENAINSNVKRQSMSNMINGRLQSKTSSNINSTNTTRKVLGVLSNNDINKKNSLPNNSITYQSGITKLDNYRQSRNSNQFNRRDIISRNDEVDDETEDELEAKEYQESQVSTSQAQYEVYVDENLENTVPAARSGETIYEEVEELEDEDEFEEEYEEEEEEEYDEDEYKVQPMSPKWNERIYNELTRVASKFHRDSPDPDDEDTYDVTMCAEYAPDIFNYLHKLEISLAPNPKYMDQQDELSWENRSTLINWVVQVHSRFNLLPETLFLTINIMDRFLSKRVISLSRFQLCGAVALFIAAKYEEINCPSVQQMVYMVSNDFTVEDLLRAERFMIDILEFEMGWPGPMSFLRRTSKADDYDNETRTLAKYFLEITVMDPRFVSSPSSWLAAGAHYLSRIMLHQAEWTEAHVFYSGYTESQLKPLADILLDCCMDYKNHHKAIFDKYSERRFKRSSIFVQEYISNVYG